MNAEIVSYRLRSERFPSQESEALPSLQTVYIFNKADRCLDEMHEIPVSLLMSMEAEEQEGWTRAGTSDDLFTSPDFPSSPC